MFIQLLPYMRAATSQPLGWPHERRLAHTKRFKAHPSPSHRSACGRHLGTCTMPVNVPVCCLYIFPCSTTIAGCDAPFFAGTWIFHLRAFHHWRNLFMCIHAHNMHTKLHREFYAFMSDVLVLQALAHIEQSAAAQPQRKYPAPAFLCSPLL